MVHYLLISLEICASTFLTYYNTIMPLLKDFPVNTPSHGRYSPCSPHFLLGLTVNAMSATQYLAFRPHVLTSLNYCSFEYRSSKVLL